MTTEKLNYIYYTLYCNNRAKYINLLWLYNSVRGRKNMSLSVKNIIKTYGDCNVVNDISFDIKEGEILGLVGHNGAGKTTTFRMILGLIESHMRFYFLRV